MARTIKFNRLGEVLVDLEYPVSREEAADSFDDVTVLLADGEVNLGEVIAGMQTDQFSSAEDLAPDIHNNLPRRAVGEPYQSEGDS